MILCASPAYIERHGVPASPHDSERQHWLALARSTPEMSYAGIGSAGDSPRTLSLDLRDGEGTHEHIEPSIRIATTSQIALQQMCEQGMGLACLFHAKVASLDVV